MWGIMKLCLMFYITAVVLLFPTSANATNIISSQELYEQCKVDLNQKDFDRTKCSFFMQGFIQSHYISIPLLSECSSSNEGIKKFVEDAYCINPITFLPKEFAKIFVDWYAMTVGKKDMPSIDAYSFIYKMMAEPKNCALQNEKGK
jgi:hypothetical protein